MLVVHFVCHAVNEFQGLNFYKRSFLHINANITFIKSAHIWEQFIVVFSL